MKSIFCIFFRFVLFHMHVKFCRILSFVSIMLIINAKLISAINVVFVVVLGLFCCCFCLWADITGA